MRPATWAAIGLAAAPWLAALIIARRRRGRPAGPALTAARLAWYHLSRLLPRARRQPGHDRVQLEPREIARLETVMRSFRERGTWADEPERGRRP